MRRRIKSAILRMGAFAVALFTLSFTQNRATADTIVFNDLTDNVSVLTTSTRVTGLSCTVNSLFESCVFTLLPPGSPPATLISGAPVTILIAENPGPSNISDEIVTGLILPPGVGVGINFFSDVDANPSSPGQCFTPPIIVLCSLVENGTVQTAAQLCWSDGIVDIIQFRSDVVPEPSSWLRLLIGFAALQTLSFATKPGE
jgi:hypothetical protein